MPESDKFGDMIVEDYNIRKYLKNTLYSAGIAKIEIERDNAKVKITFTAPARRWSSARAARRSRSSARHGEAARQAVVSEHRRDPRPDLNAQLVAENIAAQLEKRISFRRAMKQAMQQATRMGAKGIKCTCGGRLGGAEIARSETYHEGTIPLQTIRADIDYGFAEAATTYGRIGIKVWIYKGEVLNTTLRQRIRSPQRPSPRRRN